MPKKRSPTEVIESTPNPKVEHAYVKFPNKELQLVSGAENSHSVEFDWKKIKKLLKKNGRGSYTEVHTHPYHEKGDGVSQERYNSLFSPEDMRTFLCDDTCKTGVVAQVDPEDGKLYGYLVVRKTKQTPKAGFTPIQGLFGKIREAFYGSPIPEEIREGIMDYLISHGRGKFDNNHRVAEAGLRKISEKLHLNYRFVPVGKKEVYSNRISGPSIGSRLEGRVFSTTSVLAFIGSLFFTTSNLTGNVIGALSTNTTNLIGIILFLIGIAGAFLCVHKSKHL